MPRIDVPPADPSTITKLMDWASRLARRDDARFLPKPIQAMAGHPGLMWASFYASRDLLREEGYMPTAMRQAIAVYVAVLNECHFCAGEHAEYLRFNAKEYAPLADAILAGKLDELDLSEANRRLFKYVETSTKHAYRVTDEQVQDLRQVGWTDLQIAEATYVVGYMSMVVRIVDSLGVSQGQVAPAIVRP